MKSRLRCAWVAIAAASFLAIAPVQSRPLTFPAPDKELMVPVKGGRIYVRVNGDIAGPKAPIVLIHGGPGGTQRQGSLSSDS